MALVFGIANKKGGVGKSSIAHLFAITSAAEPINKKVLVIDASENKLLTFLNAYNKQSVYSFVKSSLEEVPQILAAESDSYDVVLIDFPVNVELPDFMTAAICCSDFIVPTGVGIMDQIATKDCLDSLNEVKSLRKAAGYNTNIKVLASNIDNEALGLEFYKVLDAQEIAHFKGSLIKNIDISQSIESCQQVMDYVTEGVGWTPAQDIFHKVFIEFHSQLS